MNPSAFLGSLTPYNPPDSSARRRERSMADLADIQLAEAKRAQKDEADIRGAFKPVSEADPATGQTVIRPPNDAEVVRKIAATGNYKAATAYSKMASEKLEQEHKTRQADLKAKQDELKLGADRASTVANALNSIKDPGSHRLAIEGLVQSKIFTPEQAQALPAFGTPEWETVQKQGVSQGLGVIKESELEAAKLKAQFDKNEEDRKTSKDEFERLLRPGLLTKNQGEAVSATTNAEGLTPNQAATATAQANRDASAALTTTQKDYAAAVRQGFKGTIFQFKEKLAAAGRAPSPANALSSVPGLEKVPPTLAAPAAAAYSKSSLALADANSAADEIQGVIDLVKSGNKAAGSNLPLLGVGALNAVNGIKRMNKAEIDQYRGAGSLWDRITGKVDALAEGKPIPADVLADIEALHKRLAEGATSKHNAEVDAINQSHGSSFPHATRQPSTPVAPPVMPAKLSASDVGKAYTSKNGKRLKITAVNPSDPTQFKSEDIP